MKKIMIGILPFLFLMVTFSFELKAEVIFTDGFEIGDLIGEDGGLKPTPFGLIPFPHVNLYNFTGWKHRMVKSSENIITGINLVPEGEPNPFLPPGWPHDYSKAPMSNRVLVEDGMLGVANEAGNRFAHLGGPLVPMFCPNEDISISTGIKIEGPTKYLLIEFDYLARTLDGIPGEDGNNDKAYVQIKFINQLNRNLKKLTIWEWSQGTLGIGDPETGMLYSDTDGGFAPFGKLVGDDPMNPANYEPVSLRHFSKIVKIPWRRRIKKVILTFGLITDGDPWPSCLTVDNVCISKID